MHKRFTPLSAAIASAVVASLVLPASAQSLPASRSPVFDEAPPTGPWAGYASLGAAFLPDYEGSSSYVLLPYAEGRLNRGNYYLRFEGGALRFNLVDSEDFHAGPLLGFRRGRGNVNGPVRRFRHLHDSETAGGFIEWEHDGEDPRYGESVTVWADNAVYGDKGGWAVTTRATVRWPLDFVDPGFIVALTGDLAWVSRPFARRYFGVGAADATASGLAAYSPGAAFDRVGMAVSLDQFLSRHLSVGLRGYYARLLGEAADSPVVATAGSPDQWFAGAALGYAL